MNAEQRVRNKLGDETFDTLSEAVRSVLVDQEIQIIESEPVMERHRSFLEQEERRDINLAIDREMLRESGMVERVGYTYNPFKLNRVEQGYLDLSSAFTNIESNPVSYVGGVIRGFQRSTIEGLIPQIKDIWDQANSHEDVQHSATAYIMFTIWSSGKRRIGTRAIAITSDIIDCIDKLFLALDDLIENIESVKSGYSDIYDNTKDNYIHFYFKANYYPEPKCINNWGNNIKAIEKCKFFNIFTANDINISCIVQVAQRLWLNTDITTLDDIITKASPNLCIVKPHSSVPNIKYINDYSDLVIDVNSPIKSLSIINPNAIYLLYYNGHIGILEDLKPQKRNMYFTSFRPLIKYPNTKKITMTFDIECYFDPNNDQKHVPYLCCACFIYDYVDKSGNLVSKPGNVLEFDGKDCIAQMLDYAVDNVGDFNLRDIELIAHNGGSYDFHYLLTSMYDPSIVKDILIRNNHFISFKFKHLGINFNVKDSLNFLLFSLNDAARAFLDEKDRKTDFPHHEVRSRDDLQRVFNKWITIDNIVDVNIEKEKMIITNKHIINYSKDNNAKTLMDWSREYCCNDVIVLAKVWIKFKKTTAEVFKCEIVDQTYTLAGMSFRLFEAYLPKTLDTHKGHGNIKLFHPNKNDFDNMRKSLIGGRCISVNGIYEDIICLDVKSLYPAAMAYYDQPYGIYRKVTKEIPYNIELGIYYCKVKLIKIKGHGFFPIKIDKDVYYDNYNKEYCAWYTSIDMVIGREEGHDIIPIPFDNKHVGYSWKYKGKIFKEYIEGVLYRLKLQYENSKQMEHRQVIKIIMNSLWGKFAQKWMDNKYSIINENKCDMVNDICVKLFDTDCFIVKHKENKKYSSKPIQNGIYTLSYARYHMYRLWKEIVKPGTICLYSDTDSMMISKNRLIENAKIMINDKIVPVIGKDMGQLEVEYIFDEFICVGKKQYIGKYKNKYKKRFKGVPQKFITPSLFTHLIKSKKYEAQINFLKFKREWGCIYGYNENKTVKQT